MTTKQHVLVIDDDKVTLRLTTHLFQKGGYEVHVATSGSEGLAKAATLKPNLVILDVMMPDMNGLDVCQQLRANRSTASLARSEIGQELGVPTIGSFPPTPDAFHQAAIEGNPLVLSKPETLAASVFRKLTKALTERVPIAAWQLVGENEISRPQRFSEAILL